MLSRLGCQVVSREEEMAWLELRLEYSGPHNFPTSPGAPSSPASSPKTPASTSHLGRRSTVPIQLRLLPSLQVLLLPPACWLAFHYNHQGCWCWHDSQLDARTFGSYLVLTSAHR